MQDQKLRVAVLFGGRSAEHEVSLQSASNIIAAMDTKKFEPVLIGIDREGRWFHSENSLSLLHTQDPKILSVNSINNMQVALTADGVDRAILGKNSMSVFQASM
jgi:D-alanine-D-alanine ligase